MKVHISIELGDEDRALALSVLEALHPETAHALAEARTTAPEVSFTSFDPTSASTDAGKAELEEDERLAGKPAAVNGEILPPAGRNVQQLCVGLYGRYKKAATGTGKGGVTLKYDDEVVDADGQVGKVVALVRGRAVIEYDDGTGAEVETPTLTLYVGNSASPTSVQTTVETGSGDAVTGDGSSSAEPVEQGAGPADDEPEPNPLDDGDDEPVTRDQVRALADPFMTEIGATTLHKMLLSHTASGKVKDIPEQQLPVVYAAMQKALAEHRAK